MISIFWIYSSNSMNLCVEIQWAILARPFISNSYTIHYVVLGCSYDYCIWQLLGITLKDFDKSYARYVNWLGSPIITVLYGILLSCLTFCNKLCRWILS